MTPRKPNSKGKIKFKKKKKKSRTVRDQKAGGDKFYRLSPGRLQINETNKMNSTLSGIRNPELLQYIV